MQGHKLWYSQKKCIRTVCTASFLHHTFWWSNFKWLKLLTHVPTAGNVQGIKIWLHGFKYFPFMLEHFELSVTDWDLLHFARIAALYQFPPALTSCKRFVHKEKSLEIIHDHNMMSSIRWQILKQQAIFEDLDVIYGINTRMKGVLFKLNFRHRDLENR